MDPSIKLHCIIPSNHCDIVIEKAVWNAGVCQLSSSPCCTYMSIAPICEVDIRMMHGHLKGHLRSEVTNTNCGTIPQEITEVKHGEQISYDKPSGN